MSEHNEAPKQGKGNELSEKPNGSRFRHILCMVYVGVSLPVMVIIFIGLQIGIVGRVMTWEPLYTASDINRQDPFSSSPLYRIGDTVFELEISEGKIISRDRNPYFIIGTYYEMVNAYDLFLSVYQSVEDGRRVRVNHATFEEIRGVWLETKTVPLNVEMKFVEESDWYWGVDQEGNPKRQGYPVLWAYETIAESVLTPMEYVAEDGGVIRVTLNVTVGEGDEAVTQDLVCFFQAEDDIQYVLPT